MSAEPSKSFGQITPPTGNAPTGQNQATAVPLGVRLMASDAGRKMAEMEHLFRSAGNHSGQMAALATLRRWQVDPRLDRASRREPARSSGSFNPMAGSKSDRGPGNSLRNRGGAH